MTVKSHGNHPESYYCLSDADVDATRLRKEREKARKLKNTQWWQVRVNRGVCHYCEKTFKPKDLTLDHVVPLARGGKSTPGNCVVACRSCNENKKLHTPVEQLFLQLQQENQFD
jgi:5-methylcytosine-specific restriction protein A